MDQPTLLTEFSASPDSLARLARAVSPFLDPTYPLVHLHVEGTSVRAYAGVHNRYAVASMELANPATLDGKVSVGAKRLDPGKLGSKGLQCVQFHDADRAAISWFRPSVEPPDTVASTVQLDSLHAVNAWAGKRHDQIPGIRAVHVQNRLAHASDSVTQCLIRNAACGTLKTPVVIPHDLIKLLPSIGQAAMRSSGIGPEGVHSLTLTPPRGSFSCTVVWSDWIAFRRPIEVDGLSWITLDRLPDVTPLPAVNGSVKYPPHVGVRSDGLVGSTVVPWASSGEKTEDIVYLDFEFWRRVSRVVGKSMVALRWGYPDMPVLFKIGTTEITVMPLRP